MREDIPEWLGKPPLRGTDQWEAWLTKWRRYAKVELRDAAADDPEYDFGLLTPEERWRVALALQVKAQIEAGRQNAPVPMSLALGRKVSDLDHAGVVAWQVGRSVVSPIPDAAFTAALEWSNARENPRRRRIMSRRTKPRGSSATRSPSRRTRGDRLRKARPRAEWTSS